MSDDLRDRTADVQDFVGTITLAVKESFTGINQAASSTEILSGDISNISDKIMENKQLADQLNFEAEQFVLFKFKDNM